MDDVIICKDIFKRIISDHWSAFKLAYPEFDSPDYNDVIRKMLCCGDPEKMGYAQYRCEYCGCMRRIAFSCKSSFCLSCAKGRTDQWADFISRRLIPGVMRFCERMWTVIATCKRQGRSVFEFLKSAVNSTFSGTQYPQLIA